MKWIALGGEIMATILGWSLAGWALGKWLDGAWPVVVMSMAGLVQVMYRIIKIASRKDE